MHNKSRRALKDCISVVWLSPCGPTAGPWAACGQSQRFQWPAEAFRKNFKFEICWKACEDAFVSLNCLRWIKWICTRTMNNTFSVYHYCFCLICLFYDQIRRYCPPLGQLTVWPLCFFGAPVFVVLKSTSGRMNSILPNESVYIYQLNATFWSSPRAKLIAHPCNR